MEWLTAQNVTREDVARAELRDPGLIRITNPAGQYMDLLCDQDHKVTILTITPEREDQLNYFWENETNDPDTSEWRDELTPEEMALVNEWDDRYESGLLAISRDVLKMERQKALVITPNEVGAVKSELGQSSMAEQLAAATKEAQQRNQERQAPTEQRGREREPI